MDAVCVFVNYNGQWDGTSSSYVGGEMKGILVPDNSTYVGLVELVRSVIGIRGTDKNIVMRYGVEPGLPLVRIQCDADVKFYIQLKKKDVYVLSKFPVTIDVLDESAAEAMLAEVGASNHIDVQRSRDGGQSDETMQHVNDSNTIIPPPLQFPSPTVGLNLHNEYEIEKQDEVMHNDLCTANDDCNAGKMHDADDSHRSNEKSIAASIGGHSIVNNTRSENDRVSSSDSLSDGVIVADYTPVTMRINCIFENKKLLLRGDDAESYKVLPAWAEMVMRKNSASNIQIETDSENCFKYFYMCLAASKHGWPYCRPVIVVDGSALKARFGGMLLTACRHDANGSIFPLAFGIVPSESNESWKWFFEKLRDSIGTRESLAIVADRHKGIEYAVNHVYPDAAFGICVQHLAANLKTRYKDFKGPLKTYFDGASRSYLLSEFHRHMESIRGLNPDMHRYLVEADPTKWSRAYFNGRRYAIMTINIAESFNNMDRKARLMPVGFLVEWLRALLQRWFVERREEALKITYKLAPKTEKLIRTHFSVGLSVTPRPADQFEYAVTSNDGQIWIVDMSERICTCRRFQVDQIPCPHAMAVCNYRRIDPYNYCSNYYTKDYLYSCYADVVHPIGSAEAWDVSEEVSLQIVNPPTTKRGLGRPRVRRIPSQGEEHEPIRCGRCNGYRHNRQTCTNSVPLRKRPTTRTDT
ncbi:hypothetical protein TIFTF001_029541 [Ficus carica]|uniref:SWIM-type domain-containing protein n=1 Tax=Ficus carica TaxID=3494 RepID=A0AA88DRS9_FICCA|nr:hypothetical protein TIFTF001_029541 [Ficus carica]